MSYIDSGVWQVCRVESELSDVVMSTEVCGVESTPPHTSVAYAHASGLTCRVGCDTSAADMPLGIVLP